MTRQLDLAAAVLAQLEDIVRVQRLGAGDRLDPADDLMDLGFDSVALMMLHTSIMTTYGIDLDPGVMFDCPSLAELSAYLVANFEPAVAERHGEPGDTS